jgi:hypothetical protein
VWWKPRPLQLWSFSCTSVNMLIIYFVTL